MSSRELNTGGSRSHAARADGDLEGHEGTKSTKKNNRIVFFVFFFEPFVSSRPS
jgi:hypothetical protein